MTREYICSGAHPSMPQNTRTSLQHPLELPGPPPAQGQVAHFDTILVHWQPDHCLVVETNTLDNAAAAVLLVHCNNRELCPVMFMSQSFKGEELNYNVHDKELLAIYNVFCRWCHYLEGTPETIDIVTNHKNLEYFLMTKILMR
jgi:hypothetical protein